VDYAAWNPERDKLIAAKYSMKDMSGKLTCKKNLLEIFNLPPETVSRPLIGIVSRFADQKGFDLIAKVAPDLLAETWQLSCWEQASEIRKDASRPGQEVSEKLSVKIAYDNAIAHKIEAGADMFLMPSRYEPCGLNRSTA